MKKRALRRMLALTLCLLLLPLPALAAETSITCYGEDLSAEQYERAARELEAMYE